MREILNVDHTDGRSIRVVFGRANVPHAVGLDVILDNKNVLRTYDPAEVSIWFQNNSRDNLDDWKNAYHKADIKASDYRRPSKSKIILDVPYLSQRDNKRYPGGTCNVTSYAMVALYWGVKSRGKVNKVSYVQLEDEMEAFIQANNRDRHYASDLVWMGRQYGLDCSWASDRTLEDIRNEIRDGRPVIVSTFLTSSGHVIVVVGIDGDDFICHDPWGTYHDGYSKHDNGKNVKYSAELMLSKMKNPGRNAKWTHFIRGGK